MRKLFLSLFLLCMICFTVSCSFDNLQSSFTPPYPVYEIPLNGKRGYTVGEYSEGEFSLSFDLDSNNQVIQNEIPIYEYNFTTHSKTLFYVLMNTRVSFDIFFNEIVPIIIKTNDNHYFIFQKKWNGNTYQVSMVHNDKKEIIYERKNSPKDHEIILFIDLENNKRYKNYLFSNDQFSSKEFEVVSYNLKTGIKPIYSSSGALFSIPFFETKSYYYLEVRKPNNTRELHCISKVNLKKVNTMSIGKQEPVGWNKEEDSVVLFDKWNSLFQIIKQSNTINTIKASPFKYPVDEVVYRTFNSKPTLLAISSEAFVSDNRNLRWIQQDMKANKVFDNDLSKDPNYKLGFLGYYSTRNDYYNLCMNKETRRVSIAVVNLVDGTIYYRKTNHTVPIGLEIQSSSYLSGRYFTWTETNPITDEKAYDNQTIFNPTDYYCSLEEPLLQLLKPKK